jgi:hypothetical protein
MKTVSDASLWWIAACRDCGLEVTIPTNDGFCAKTSKPHDFERVQRPRPSELESSNPSPEEVSRLLERGRELQDALLPSVKAMQGEQRPSEAKADVCMNCGEEEAQPGGMCGVGGTHRLRDRPIQAAAVRPQEAPPNYPEAAPTHRSTQGRVLRALQTELRILQEDATNRINAYERLKDSQISVEEHRRLLNEEASNVRTNTIKECARYLDSWVEANEPRDQDYICYSNVVRGMLAPEQNNELKCYNMADIRNWLQEIMGGDGIGEHVHTGHKNAATLLLDLIDGDLPYPKK